MALLLFWLVPHLHTPCAETPDEPRSMTDFNAKYALKSAIE